MSTDRIANHGASKCLQNYSWNYTAATKPDVCLDKTELRWVQQNAMLIGGHFLANKLGCA